MWIKNCPNLIIIDFNWGGENMPEKWGENPGGEEYLNKNDGQTDESSADETLGAGEEQDASGCGLQEEGIKAGGEEQSLTLEVKLAQAEAQAKEYYGHLQRLQADFDNYRKRTQKEKEETIKYAAEKVITAMLPVVDNFERAVASARTSQDFAGFAQGVEMILKQMQNVLSKEGLSVIKAVGEPFDPNLHDAVMQVESGEHPENTVVEELQKGYYLKEKVLRPSMVKVSR